MSTPRCCRISVAPCLTLFLVLGYAAPTAWAVDPPAGGQFAVYVDAALTTPGLTGSYVNNSLSWYKTQDDWRDTRPISGTRVDPVIDFATGEWGARNDSGVSGIAVEWDLDGDGVFDTPPTTNRLREVSYQDAGVTLIRVRATDSDGNVTVSTPIAVRVVDRATDVNRDGRVQFYDAFMVWQDLSGPGASTSAEADVDGDGDVDIADYALVQQAAEAP